MIHLIMPMGGAGSRFYENGYMLPKPLIEIKNKPFLYWATRSIQKYVEVKDITFVVLQKHIDENRIDDVIRKYFPRAVIKAIPHVLPGPVFTALQGIKEINDDFPIIFNDCDHMFRCKNINSVMNAGMFMEDGALLTFKSNEPQFSYVRYSETEDILGTVEKQVVSDRAICGAYAFKNAAIFRRLADEYMESCPYNELYMSGLFNVMIQNGLIVKDYHLDFHVEFGTPEEYEKAKDSEQFSDLEAQ